MSNVSSDVPPNPVSKASSALGKMTSKIHTPKNPKKGSGSFPGPFGVILNTIGVFLISQLVAGVIITAIGTAQGIPPDRLGEWLSNATSAQFGFVLLADGLVILTVMALLKANRLQLSDIGFKRPRGNVIGAAVIGLISFYLLAGIIGAIILQLLPGINTDQEQDIGFEGASSQSELGLVFLSLVVIVPLAEEILSRGYLFSGLRARLSFIWTLLITSVLFGMAHLQTASDGQLTWAIVINIFFLALVLGYLREKTGTIWAGVIMHGLNNLIAFIIRF